MASHARRARRKRHRSLRNRAGATRRRYTLWHHIILFTAFIGMPVLARPLFRNRRRLLYRVVGPRGEVVGMRWSVPGSPPGPPRKP